MILIEIVCVLINLINLTLALKLKNIVVEGEYIIESQEIRRVLVGPFNNFNFSQANNDHTTFISF
ncbi:hypothetical protein P6O23_08855 [Clostridium perfringens]|nr:hypothetical protein [Clostridium perfringens]